MNKLFNFLLSRSVNVNVKDISGNSPLLHLVIYYKKNNINLIKSLLQH